MPGAKKTNFTNPARIYDDVISSLGGCRPSHLKIPGGPKMARATLSRRAIDRPCAVM